MLKFFKSRSHSAQLPVADTFFELAHQLVNGGPGRLSPDACLYAKNPQSAAFVLTHGKRSVLQRLSGKSPSKTTATVMARAAAALRAECYDAANTDLAAAVKYFGKLRGSRIDSEFCAHLHVLAMVENQRNNRQADTETVQAEQPPTPTIATQPSSTVPLSDSASGQAVAPDTDTQPKPLAKPPSRLTPQKFHPRLPNSPRIAGRTAASDPGPTSPYKPLNPEDIIFTVDH